jgi:hypothetical protein
MKKRHLKLRASLWDRFHDMVIPEPNSGCWLWLGALHTTGYGVMGLGRREEGIDRAHRIAVRLYGREIPAGHFVCHRCDNQLCANPDHLFVGTPSDNARDMVAKKRWRGPDNRGEKAKWSKLKEPHVRHIKRKELTAVAYAKMYGVSRSAIYMIWDGHNWPHIHDGG